MNTLEIKHQVPVTVETKNIELPFCFSTGRYLKTFYCMTEERKLITIYDLNGNWHVSTRSYKDDTEAAERLKKEIDQEHYLEITPDEFEESFTKAHRELYYSLNHHLRPNEEQ
jgi:hypothetical protein